jgi:hypothetical protein
MKLEQELGKVAIIALVFSCLELIPVIWGLIRISCF